jgi:hypothetical protein
MDFCNPQLINSLIHFCADLPHKEITMSANEDIQSNQIEIAELAQSIWEAEGQPEGKALEHWLQAEAQLRVEKEAKARRKQGRAPILNSVEGGKVKAARNGSRR